MSEYVTLSSNELEALKKNSTPSVCNAIETFKLQKRTEGFILDEVRAMKFQLFAKRAIPSHAYVHLVDVGKPVTIGGLTVTTGDIIHADPHGVTRVPIEVAREIPGAAKKIEEKEQEIIRYCRSSEFTVEGLKRLQKQA